MATDPVWCLVIDCDKKHVGQPFKVSGAEDIAELKEKAKEKKPSDLQGIDADHLIVSRGNNMKTPFNFRNIEAGVKKIFDKGVEELYADQTIAELGLSKKEVLLVQVPSAYLLAQQLDVTLGTNQLNISPSPNTDMKLILDQAAEIHSKISLISGNPEDYSDPSRVFKLPFPSVNPIPARFACNDDRSIDYMGRESFETIWNTFIRIKDNFHRCRHIYVYGVMGYGKSHILMALTCLFIRQGYRVVYIPDCREMLESPYLYLKLALYSAFGDSPASVHSASISQCEDIEGLIQFCLGYHEPDGLCFIIDQLNALDLEPVGRDDIVNKRKASLTEQLQRMVFEHTTVMSASANYQSAMYMARKDTNDEKIPLMGGMTTSEMSCWWKRHDAHFTAFDATDKQRVEDLTGCIPLLLKPFLAQSGKPLASLEPQIWEDEVLASVGKYVADFAMEKQQDQSFHAQFVPLMCDCLKGSLINGFGKLMDHRYFYIDSTSHGRYFCGLARQSMIWFLREHGEEKFFLSEGWLDTLRHFRNNSSVVGFVVEQIVIGRIASAGVKSSDLDISPAKIITFPGSVTSLSTEDEKALYVPMNFDLKNIDAIFVDLDQTKKTAHVVAIQITVAKRHKDSSYGFFQDRGIWLERMERTGFDITTSFLWIDGDKRGKAEVDEELFKLRGRTVQKWPSHKVYWVSIEQVDKQLAGTLASIQ